MKRDNLIGFTYGYLTVLEDAGTTKAGHAQFLCNCKCGNQVIRTGTSLKRSNHSSCGCWSRVGKDNPNWEGVGEISKNWFYNVVHRSASGRKSRSGITKKLDITLEYIWDLFLKQNRKCRFTGLELTFPVKNTSSAFKESTASLDRIDSTKGYVKNNVQWVHKKVNFMKGTLSDTEFIEFCKLISKNT